MDDLAEKYAKHALEWHTMTTVVASAHLVLGKCCRKRGDEAGMKRHCEEAATQCLGNYRPLLALRIGRELGGYDGRRMMEEAAARTGRPTAEHESLFAEVEALMKPSSSAALEY